jgi:hypothetical protein
MQSILLSVVVLGGAGLMVSNGAQPPGSATPSLNVADSRWSELNLLRDRIGNQIAEATIKFKFALSVSKAPETDPAVQQAAAALKILKAREAHLAAALRQVELARADFQRPEPPPEQLAVDKVSDDNLESLRQQFMALTNERAERMDGIELKKAIAEMRMEQIAASLMKLANESEDNHFVAARAKLAARILGAKNQDEVEEIIRTLGQGIARAKEIDSAGFKPRDE